MRTIRRWTAGTWARRAGCTIANSSRGSGIIRRSSWNLGEENTNTGGAVEGFFNYIRRLDPYDHPIVVHTFPGQYAQVYEPMLGYADFDGASLQMNETGSDTHSETVMWLDRSAQAGWKWNVCLDEYGHGANGVRPDAMDPGHDEARKNCLWANLMAGGGGVEWYFGYKFPHNDLNCEDWRSRDHLWDLTRYAVEFFHAYLPFVEMKHADELTAAGTISVWPRPAEFTPSTCPRAAQRPWTLAGPPAHSQSSGSTQEPAAICRTAASRRSRGQARSLWEIRRRKQATIGWFWFDQKKLNCA